MVQEETDASASGYHLRPDKQTDSLSFAGQDALAELCLPGESYTKALGIAGMPGRCPWPWSSRGALHGGRGR